MLLQHRLQRKKSSLLNLARLHYAMLSVSAIIFAFALQYKTLAQIW